MTCPTEPPLQSISSADSAHVRGAYQMFASQKNDLAPNRLLPLRSATVLSFHVQLNM